MRIRIATRGSRLSLIQTEIVMNMIRRVEPNVRFDVIIVRTTGDVIQDKPLYAIGVKGIFEKEVNLALLRNEADIAVHSLKDLPSEISPGLVVAGFSPRDPPFDVLVVKDDYPSELMALPSGARVGTSSVRRRAFLLNVRRDISINVIRGNVDTRINKLIRGDYDAIVIAEAGLVRLINDVKSLNIKYTRISPDVLPPAPGQGIIAVVAREKDTDLVDLLNKASDPKARAEALAERAFLRTIGGGCHVPVGGMAIHEGARMEFIAGMADLNGERKVLVKLSGSPSNPEELGVNAARELLKRWSEG
ncbi:hydroxymethylbilane synthase [Vulcanisaeta distributa]|uniref:Probable porphobilinogen deaminase n=1 Tax=Vulcanisaeta distributa (strain DSM 14429 / JCM 11212 / NBRC 100878 / IC-017) TaxID=572478 RepID=E1QUK4_VULDI|nr:hydroxymethylbilane synthase [Vulcanisaeta distributa]ADN51123.1 porphobilinogen deaminase [Vulcanisaeta distributa DSM 14429]